MLIAFSPDGNISLDTIWEEIEDISRSIVQVDERPSVTTGRFCDLFIGTHDTQGKVALKRPRIDQQDYSTGDVRVSQSFRTRGPSFTYLHSENSAS